MLLTLPLETQSNTPALFSQPVLLDMQLPQPMLLDMPATQAHTLRRPLLQYCNSTAIILYISTAHIYQHSLFNSLSLVWKWLLSVADQ